MARTRGTLGISANFEPKTAAPFDARSIVATKAELILQSTWLNADGNVYTYKGMVVSVTDDPTATNNGIYRLKAADYTVSTNWEIAGTGAGGDGHTHANKAALDKIGESAGNPTWNGGAWPGGGGTGVSVTNATINGSGHLIITLSDNTTIDAGVAVGPQGATGATGATGNGIASSSYNASTGVLTITYTSGGTYSTGDLRGAAGATGAAGSKWYNGAGAPSAGTGVSGDYYLNTTNGDVYVKTTSWAVLTNIKGATGATGANGATWLSGSSAPTTQGVNGDFYLNTTTYDVSLKTANTWNVVVNIKGPIGNTGNTGATGATGKGISSITKTNTVGQIDTYTITYTDSTTTTFDVVNGANYTHPTGDGNQHVPATSTTSNGKVLTAGATAGSAAWEAPAIGDAHGFVAPPNSGNFSIAANGSYPNAIITLLANAGAFKINGASFTAREMSLTTTLVLGQNFIYCALNNGVPTLYKTTGNAQWTITDLATIPVATLNWDETNVRVSDELHLASRNLIQHQKEHDTDGARYVSGFATTFASGATNTFSAATGKIRDEERYHEIAAKTTAQIAYRNAAGTAMIFDAPGTAFVKLGGTGGARPLYDNGSGTPVELGSSQYGIMWMYATNGKLPANSEIVFVMGQGTYATVAAAQAANQPTLSGMSVAEWKLLYRVIIRQSPTNALVYTQADDFRLSTSGPAQNAGSASVVSAAGVTVTPIATLPETNVQAALERLSQYQGAFAEEYVTVAAGSGNTITLKKDTLTAISNVLDSTVTGLVVNFPTPVPGSLNQSILYFKIGETLPTGLSMLGGFTPLSTPVWTSNSTWQFIYTQVRVGESTWNKLVSFSKLA